MNIIVTGTPPEPPLPPDQEAFGRYNACLLGCMGLGALAKEGVFELGAKALDKEALAAAGVLVSTCELINCQGECADKLKIPYIYMGPGLTHHGPSTKPINVTGTTVE